MAKKGGYQIVDFMNENLTADGVVIPDVYETIEGNYNKALLLSGLVIGGAEKADVYAPAIVNGGDYTFAVYGGTITVADTDTVTFS